MRFAHCARWVPSKAHTFALAVQSGDIPKRSPVVLVWIVKALPLAYVNCIYIKCVCANDECVIVITISIFQRLSMDGKNAAKTVVLFMRFQCENLSIIENALVWTTPKKQIPFELMITNE